MFGYDIVYSCIFQYFRYQRVPVFCKNWLGPDHAELSNGCPQIQWLMIFIAIFHIVWTYIEDKSSVARCCRPRPIWSCWRNRKCFWVSAPNAQLHWQRQEQGPDRSGRIKRLVCREVPHSHGWLKLKEITKNIQKSACYWDHQMLIDLET